EESHADRSSGWVGGDWRIRSRRTAVSFFGLFSCGGPEMAPALPPAADTRRAPALPPAADTRRAPALAPAADTRRAPALAPSADNRRGTIGAERSLSWPIRVFTI